MRSPEARGVNSLEWATGKPTTRVRHTKQDAQKAITPVCLVTRAENSNDCRCPHGRLCVDGCRSR